MNWFDFLLIGLIALSCVTGFVRGLLRELISLLTLVLAVWFAWAYADLLMPHLGGALALEGVRVWAARALIFIGVMVLGTTLGAVIAMFVRLSIFSPLDRSLGGLFGLLRSAVLVGLLVIIGHALRLDGEGWWRGSILVPYAEGPANMLRGMVGERRLDPDHSITASR